MDVVKESPVYSSGGFVDTYNTSIQHTPAGYATGERGRLQVYEKELDKENQDTGTRV